MPTLILSLRQTLLRFLPVCLLFFCLSPAGLSDAQTRRSPDMLALQGRWIRTDSPYVIELRNAEDGSFQAAYFNPKQIHVGKTEVAEKDGFLLIMIELQDVNYPGSTYALRYNRAQDVLQGIYFHPASQQSYEVSFVRQIAQ
jgi:hypothetical protein